MPNPWERQQPGRTATHRALQAHLVNLRAEMTGVEEILGLPNELSDKEFKRLDKAMTLMKAGLKIAKKALKRSHEPDVVHAEGN